MASKQVIIFFPRRKAVTVERTLIQNIRSVFGEAIQIRVLYADQLRPDQTLKADLFLVLTLDGANDLKGQVENLGDVLPITRSIRRQMLPAILTIPKGAEVLVVNDTYPLVAEFMNDLIGLGISQINWIPYKEQEDAAGAYRDLQLAICPNEKELVPDYIPQIIDLGERYIDTYTMVRISSKLQLRTPEIERRLLEYSRQMAEPETSMAGIYFDNYRKTTLLEQYVHHSGEGVLLCDEEYRCLYRNQEAGRLFAGAEGEDMVRRSLPQVCGEDFYSGMIRVEETNYLVVKSPVWLDQILAGYSITLRDEKSIHDMGADLSHKLSDHGMKARYTFQDICHHSARMAEVIQRARQAAGTQYPVLIRGESGTGKELIAQSIHNASPRKEAPFVAVNCAAMPQNLLESELFGYEGGAFTGARRQGKAGLFEQAQGGTLFLDEIGDMPAPLQALLLRALQEKQIMRVGGDRLISVDVRIIGATNKDLYAQVQKGEFRADLYYRLNTLPLELPALRQRPEDIPLLLRRFLGKDWQALTPAQREHLARQPWPGNVRQLENFAHYYKTTHTLTGFFRPEEEGGPAAEPMGGPDYQILSRVAQATAPAHGIGRSALLEELRRAGLRVSDGWLREQLCGLKAKGLLEIRRGRAGCRITEEGRRWLDNALTGR